MSRRPAGVSRVLARLLAFWGVLAASAAGCGPSAANNCPNQQVPACPAVAPSFAAEVDPIIQGVCVTCHSPGGMEASRPLTTYAQITAPVNKGTAFGQLLDCLMPPANAPKPLTPAERQTLLEWFACGAPADADGGAPADAAGDAPADAGSAADAADGGAPD